MDKWAMTMETHYMHISKEIMISIDSIENERKKIKHKNGNNCIFIGFFGKRAKEVMYEKVNNWIDTVQ